MDVDDDFSEASASASYAFPSVLLSANEDLCIAEETAGIEGTWLLMDMPASTGAQNPFLVGPHRDHQTQQPSSPTSQAGSQLPTTIATVRTPPRKTASSENGSPTQGTPGSGTFFAEGNGASFGPERLEKSRQSAKECRARKKLRYQYLEEMISSREKAIGLLRQELDMYRSFAREIDEGRIPEGVVDLIQRQIKADESVKGINALQLGADQ